MHQDLNWSEFLIEVCFVHLPKIRCFISKSHILLDHICSISLSYFTSQLDFVCSAGDTIRLLTPHPISVLHLSFCDRSGFCILFLASCLAMHSSLVANMLLDVNAKLFLGQTLGHCCGMVTTLFNMHE